MSPLPTPEELRTRLDELRAARGYLLPHHGAMAAAAPDLHDAYLNMYAALTLTRRHLDPFERELIWLAILTAEHEAIGTHHLELFAREGGTLEQARTVFQLVGYAGAADAFGFVQEHWDAFYGGLDHFGAYLDGVQALRGPAVTAEQAQLALLAVQAARACPWGVAAHIREAYRLAIAEHKLVEALSLIIWPTGVNRFLEACAVWHELMAAGAVTPSASYQAWADTPAGPYRKGAPGL